MRYVLFPWRRLRDGDTYCPAFLHRVFATAGAWCLAVAMCAAASEPSERWIKIGRAPVRHTVADLYIDAVSLDAVSTPGWVTGWTKFVFDNPGKFDGKPVASATQQVTAHCGARVIDAGQVIFYDASGSTVGRRPGEGDMGPLAPESAGELLYLVLCQHAWPARDKRNKPAQ